MKTLNTIEKFQFTIVEKVLIFVIIFFLIMLVFCGFLLGLTYENKQINLRAKQMIINDEIPQDKLAVSALDYIVNARTKGELNKEISEIKKDSVKIKEFLKSQE